MVVQGAPSNAIPKDMNKIDWYVTANITPKRKWCAYFLRCTVYPKKYAHCFVVLCFVVVMQSFIMNSHEVFIHIHQGCFAGTGSIVRLPQCQWSKPDGYGKISQCITTTKHSKAKTVCIFLGIYCIVPELTNRSHCMILLALSLSKKTPSHHSPFVRRVPRLHHRGSIVWKYPSGVNIVMNG